MTLKISIEINYIEYKTVSHTWVYLRNYKDRDENSTCGVHHAQNELCSDTRRDHIYILFFWVKIRGKVSQLRHLLT